MLDSDVIKSLLKYQNSKLPVKYKSLADSINNIVGPYRPSALMSVDALIRVGRTVAFLPPDLTNAFGFECQMSGNDLDADFFMRVPPEKGGPGFLSDFKSLHSESLGWKHIGRYCAEWDQPASQLHDVISHIWFEFDTAAESGKFQLPSIVFWHSPAILAGAGRAHLQADVLDTSNRLLAGEPIATEARDLFVSSISELPGTAFVFCAGLMMERAQKEFRLCLKGFTHSEILPYLARIGWEGRIDIVEDVMSAIGAYADTVQILLGIDKDISTRLHLEFRCDESFAPRAADRWRTLLDKMIDTGIATTDRAADLLGWPGFPFEMVNASLSENLYVRIIDHVKVVIESDGSLHAKCYFGVWETIRVHESALKGQGHFRQIPSGLSET